MKDVAGVLVRVWRRQTAALSIAAVQAGNQTFGKSRTARKDMAFGKQAHYSFQHSVQTHHMQRAIQH
jgi:hypothetical protein